MNSFIITVIALMYIYSDVKDMLRSKGTSKAGQLHTTRRLVPYGALNVRLSREKERGERERERERSPANINTSGAGVL